MNPSYSGYRAVAFFAVFLFHADFAKFGYLGVQAFFVLSGFLITPILVNTKKNSDGFKSFIKNFLTRRILRIFPLYYLYLTLLLLAISFPFVGKLEYFAPLREQIIYGFTYTYNFYHQTIFFVHNLFISHFWSLAVEEQFYLIWPLFVFFTPSGKFKKVLIAIILFGPIIRFLTGVAIESTYFPFLGKDKAEGVYVSTLSHLDAFATGAFFSLYVVKAIKARMVYLTIFSVIILGYITSYYSTKSIFLTSLGYYNFMGDSHKYIWGYSALNLCFGLVLYKMKSRSFFPLIFENGIMVYLGKISYGLYVYHYGVMYLVNTLTNKVMVFYNWEHTTTIRIISVFIALIITIFVSAISFKFFEEKFILLKDKIAPKKLSMNKN